MSRVCPLVPSAGPPFTLSGHHEARKGVGAGAAAGHGISPSVCSTSPPSLGVSPRLVSGSVLERQQLDQMQQQYERALCEAREFADARVSTELSLLTEEDREEWEEKRRGVRSHLGSSFRRGGEVPVVAKQESSQDTRRVEQRQAEGGFLLSSSEEEWLCSQFAGHERLFLRHSTRNPFARYRASSRCSPSSPTRSASSSQEKAKMGKTEGFPDRGSEARRHSSTPPPPPLAGKDGRPGHASLSANVVTFLLPFPHWLGISTAAKKEPPTASDAGLSSRLSPEGLCTGHAKGFVGPENPCPLTPLLDLLPLDLQRSLRRKGDVFLQAQKQKEHESRMKILQAARKKRAYRALDRGAPRRGCDAADSDEEKGQFSSSEGELEPCSAKRRNCQERTPTTKRRRDKGDGDNRKHAGLEVDSYDRGPTQESGASRALSTSPERPSGWTPSATLLECTRLLAFDSLSCPALTKVSDEKLPGVLLRFLQSKNKKAADAEVTRQQTSQGRSKENPKSSSAQSASGGCSKGVETLEEEEPDESGVVVPPAASECLIPLVLEPCYDPQSVKAATALVSAWSLAEAAVPLLVRLVTQRVAELPATNTEAKASLLRYQLAAHSVEWKAALLSGYSVLVAGFGSKKALLDLFALSSLREGFCCIINGYRRELRLQYCLLDLLYALANHVRRDASKHPEAAAEVARIFPKDQRQGTGGPLAPPTTGEAVGFPVTLGRVVKEVKRLARRLRVPLYFVVHNLDAPALRGNCRRALASLASCGNIHFVCSADHRLHGCVLGTSEREDFNFLYHQCHTYQDYRNEVLGHWGPACLFMPLWVRNSGGATGFSAAEGGASGVWGSGVNFSAVVDALTTNHKRLLKCLAEKQLSQVKSGEGPAVSMEALSNPMFALTGNFDRSKVLQLLVELTSHGAAVKTSVAGGQEALYIRANPKQLEQLLSIFEQHGI